MQIIFKLLFLVGGEWIPCLETLSLLPNFYMSFIYFSCLIGTDRTSRKMLNWIGENRHPCLVPDL